MKKLIKRCGTRFTIGQMYKKYQALSKQNYEMVIINEVLIDLHRIMMERKIPKEDL